MKQQAVFGIVGTGMIGIGLAALFTGNGYPTVVYTRNKETCLSRYRATFAELIRYGKVTPEEAEICSGYLTVTESYEGLRDAEYVFEAVPEILEVKHQVYASVELHCQKLRALASTTSSFSVNELSGNLHRLRERFLIAHPFYPPHIVLYVELVGTTDTKESVLKDVASHLRSMHRQVVRLGKDAPGCIANRLQYALFREAINLVEQGVATPEDIDTALRYSFSPRYTSIGLFEHMDNAGLDLLQTASNTIYPTLNCSKQSQDTINAMVAQGKLGCKSGNGFYQWDSSRVEALRARAVEPYLDSFQWSIPKE